MNKRSSSNTSSVLREKIMQNIEKSSFIEGNDKKAFLEKSTILFLTNNAHFTIPETKNPIILIAEKNTKGTIQEKDNLQKEKHFLRLFFFEENTEYLFLHSNTEKDNSFRYYNFLEKNAKLKSFDFHKDYTKKEYTSLTHCLGENTTHILQSFFLGKKKSSLNLTHKNIFSKEMSRGEILVKGILKNEAQSELIDKIILEKNTMQSKTNLHQKILQLSPKTHVKTYPILQIQCNDVIATHGTSISQIPEKDLFYMSSRGIEKKRAESLYVQGFFVPEYENSEDKKFVEGILKDF